MTTSVHAPAIAAPARATAWLQPKCACGAASGLTGQCSDCARKSLLGLQRKLSIGTPGDHYEQEADRAADRVLQGGSRPALAPLRAPAVQRRDDDERENAPPSPVGEASAAAVQSTLASGGASLEPSARQFMESRFGHDFGSVRVHADAQAATSAQSVGARAYTVGADLVFGRGQYAPATPAGRHLLAHELAHVVQQGGGGGLMQRQLTAEELDDFDTDEFAVAQLESYLATHGPGKIEDNNDSDDKARRIVRLWKGKKAPFTMLSAAQKILLIQEMQSGYTGNDDERGILALLLDCPPTDLAEIFAAINPVELDSDFQGAEEDVLRAFFDKNFVGGRKEALRGSRKLVARDGAASKDGAAEAEAAKTAAAQKLPVREGEQDLVVLLDDPALKPLAGVLAANATTVKPTSPQALAKLLANIKHPIGTMFVLSHGDDSASVKFGTSWYTPEKVAAALAGSVPAGKEPVLVDFRGCRIGMSPPGMEAIRTALNAGAVVGSTCWMLSTPIGATVPGQFAKKSKADQDVELAAAVKALQPKEARPCIIDRTAAAYIRAGDKMVAIWYTPRRSTEFDQLYSKCHSSLTPTTVDPKLVAKSQSSISHDCQLIRVEKKK